MKGRMEVLYPAYTLQYRSFAKNTLTTQERWGERERERERESLQSEPWIRDERRAKAGNKTGEMGQSTGLCTVKSLSMRFHPHAL